MTWQTCSFEELPKVTGLYFREGERERDLHYEILFKKDMSAKVKKLLSKNEVTTYLQTTVFCLKSKSDILPAFSWSVTARNSEYPYANSNFKIFILLVWRGFGWGISKI